jgi:precorrin-2 dehydrogenase/sirohydrochlorin ferrochelatase
MILDAAFLDLRGWWCLVVGGGEVATRKVNGLLDASAMVCVVSPEVSPALAALAGADVIEYRGRGSHRHDVRGCTLVVAATGIDGIDTAAAVAARRAKALVNVVDVPAACDFILPSVLRRGHMQIAV